MSFEEVTDINSSGHPVIYHANYFAQTCSLLIINVFD